MRLEKMIFRPFAGDILNECIREAIEKCSKNAVDVEFVHNDRLYRVIFDDLMKVCRKQK